MAILYRSDDVGSPGLPDSDDSYASVKPVFMNCLVNGYGTGDDAKAGAGWTVAFEDDANEVFVLQNSDGVYFRFSRDGATSGSYQHWHVTSYRTMTDASTGTGAGQPGKFSFRGSAYVTDWLLIADSRGFYLIPRQGTTSHNGAVWYIGPLTTNPFDQSFDGIITSFGSGSSSGRVYSTNARGLLHHHYYIFDTYKFNYSDTAADGSRAITKLLKEYPAFEPTHERQLDSQNGHLIGGRFYVGTDNLLMGHFPGFLLPAYKPLDDSGSTAAYGDIVTINGKSAVAVYLFANWHGSFKIGSVLIELENWHG